MDGGGRQIGPRTQIPDRNKAPHHYYWGRGPPFHHPLSKYIINLASAAWRGQEEGVVGGVIIFPKKKAFQAPRREDLSARRGRGSHRRQQQHHEL